MKVILVDDSSFQRNHLRKLLEAQGHSVTAFNNAKAALEVLSQETFDCVVTDLLMPEMDGREFTLELRKVFKSLPVVILTADVQNIAKEECLSSGATAVIHKPITEEKLQELLKAVHIGVAA